MPDPDSKVTAAAASGSLGPVFCWIQSPNGIPMLKLTAKGFVMDIRGLSSVL